MSQHVASKAQLGAMPGNGVLSTEAPSPELGLATTSPQEREVVDPCSGGLEPSSMTIEEVARQEGSDPDRGLSALVAAQKLERDGPNELEKVPQPSLLMLFLTQLTSFVIFLLIAAATASVVVNATGPNKDDILSYTTGKAIFLLVLINAGIAAWTEHQAGGALEALSKMSQASIYVLRDGLEMKVETTSIVRGDVVVLGTGDVVPADMRLMEADDVKVSEMALTGEPEDVAKSVKMKAKKAGEPEKLTPDNMVFSGCSVTGGKGKGIVVATGMGTRIGRIAELMAGEKGKNHKKSGCLPDTSVNATPLQKNVEKLGARIGVLAIAVCIVVFVFGVCLGRSAPGDADSSPWLYMILISVTLAVAAIPEGIPLCVTISLSIGCQDMVKKNVLVRKLAAVETLGSASVVCSDKTGTLTEGKMTMVKMWSGGVAYNVTGKGFDPTIGSFSRSSTGTDANSDLGVKSSLLAALLCCNTSLEKVTDPETGDEKWEPKGNSSEAPIVVASRKAGVAQDIVDDYSRVLEVPFSSSRKMMLTVTDVAGRDYLCDGGMPLPRGTQFLTVCKGAPNYIIDLCAEQMGEDGGFEPLTPTRKANILSIVDEYSSLALRVLAIAVRPMEELPFNTADEDVDMDTKFKLCRQDLRLVGLVASIDPDRDGVKESVDVARGAGIRVVMITGDYLKTAVAIARNVRILQGDDDEALTTMDCGALRPDDQYLPEKDLDALTAHARVFARAKPEDKLEIVRSLQRQGLVSAMTGDGVNDAPALNQANIGVAMGIQGTEVAKGAADMILTDDNFCSIVSAVEKGRAIYAGIQKFVAFIMSVHIAEVIQIFVCIVAGFPPMRTPLQILFLILVTDLPPSIALGMEPGEKSILKQRPRPRDEPVVLGWMWISILMNSVVLSVVILTVYMAALLHFCDGDIFQEDIHDMDALMRARTVAFISLVFAENVRAYTSRSFDRPFWQGLLSNASMQKAVVIAQVCLYAAVLIPYFSSEILGLWGVGIGGWGWGLALAGPVATLLLCEACKVITRYQMKQYHYKLMQDTGANEGAVKNEKTDIVLKIGDVAEEVIRQISKESYSKLT